MYCELKHWRSAAGKGHSEGSEEGDKGRREHRYVEPGKKVAGKQRETTLRFFKYKHVHAHREKEREGERGRRRPTHAGSTLARALAAAAPALVSVRAKSWGRRVLPNAAVICFGNATAVNSHGPF